MSWKNHGCARNKHVRTPSRAASRDTAGSWPLTGSHTPGPEAWTRAYPMPSGKDSGSKGRTCSSRETAARGPTLVPRTVIRDLPHAGRGGSALRTLSVGPQVTTHGLPAAFNQNRRPVSQSSTPNAYALRSPPSCALREGRRSAWLDVTSFGIRNLISSYCGRSEK